jgi:hypothetical protein
VFNSNLLFPQQFLQVIRMNTDFFHKGIILRRYRRGVKIFNIYCIWLKCTILGGISSYWLPACHPKMQHFYHDDLWHLRKWSWWVQSSIVLCSIQSSIHTKVKKPHMFLIFPTTNFWPQIKKIGGEFLKIDIAKRTACR